MEAANWGPGARVGVIGGAGEMGSLFSRFFREKGYDVVISDPKIGMDNLAVIEASDIILFSVPLHRSVDIIAEIVPAIRKEQLLMDLTSLKVDTVAAMLKSPASVVGLHPMFGGRISSYQGQTLAACPARISSDQWTFLQNLFTESGFCIKKCTPEEHDRMMAIIQVLFHMTTMLTGRVLREFGVDIDETMEFTSPVYRLEINLLGRMFAQSGELYAAITGLNPYTGKLIELLNKGLSYYQQCYEAKKLSDLVRDFDLSAAYLGDFCQKSYTESQELLDFGMRMGNGANKK